MATVRLVIVLLILGTVILLAVQNTSPALPLVFLGGQTVTLPLAVWLLLAIALGALTTLVFTALLGTGVRRGNRSKAYKYRPQPFYEPTDAQTAAREVAEDESFEQRSGRSASWFGQSRRPQRDRQDTNNANYGSEWQAWTNLQSENQVHDWEAMDQAAQSRQAGATAQSDPGPGAGGGIGSWLFGNRKATEEAQVKQSWQELSDDWGDVEHQNYRARGVSPVDENLDDINQGWSSPPEYNHPSQDFEAPQSPKRVYQDGSLYSYSYHNQEQVGQRDNIYAPPDDVVYGDEGFDRDAYVDLSQPGNYGTEADPDPGPADYGAGGYEGEDLGDPEVAEDGVVDADYRVIIPPAPASDEIPADATEASSGKGVWDGSSDEDDDDWNEAEDALTP